jgi:hypothetical protein
VRDRLKDLDLSYDVIGISRTTSGRTRYQRKGSRLLNHASRVILSADKMGVIETVNVDFVLPTWRMSTSGFSCTYEQPPASVGITFKAWTGLPKFLQDGALHFNVDYHGSEELFRHLNRVSSYLLGIRVDGASINLLRKLLVVCRVKSATFDRHDSSFNLTPADMESIFVSAAPHCGALTDLAFRYQRHFDVYFLFLILRACPNLTNLALIGNFVWCGWGLQGAPCPFGAERTRPGGLEDPCRESSSCGGGCG